MFRYLALAQSFSSMRRTNLSPIIHSNHPYNLTRMALISKSDYGLLFKQRRQVELFSKIRAGNGIIVQSVVTVRRAFVHDRKSLNRFAGHAQIKLGDNSLGVFRFPSDATTFVIPIYLRRLLPAARSSSSTQRR